MTVFVINKYGERLMPTTRLGKVRHLLKDGKATIYKRKPFTIRLTYETTNYVQPMELCADTGYLHIGVSAKSEKREYIGNQYDLLTDEKERHDDCRKYRRTRRNHLRYRTKRIDNRKGKTKGWLAPSLKNKADQHITIINSICAVAPITSVTLEMGQFDTQLMQAIDDGKPIPEGVDYQHGEQYGIETLRKAVFLRDHYTCQFCGRTIKDGAIFHAHHAYYWRGQHGSRMSELMTVCEKCHTPPNHQKGGKLWGYNGKLKSYQGASFMNTVRWYIYNKVKEHNPDVEVKITYGIITNEKRTALDIEKSHINDAYSMGDFHPQERAIQYCFKKLRRNNRILAKFYDAKYVDSRDEQKHTGKDLFNGRINRNHKKDSENLHIYRKQKIKNGYVSVRTHRYPITTGDIVLYQNKEYTVSGLQNGGAYIKLQGLKKVPSVKAITLKHRVCGWQRV